MLVLGSLIDVEKFGLAQIAGQIARLGSPKSRLRGNTTNDAIKVNYLFNEYNLDHSIYEKKL